MNYFDELHRIIENDYFSLVGENEENFVILFRETKLFLNKEDFMNYLELKDSIVSEPETSVFFDGHYEQFIEKLSYSPLSRRIRDENDDIALSTIDEKINMRIGTPTINFILHNFMNEGFICFRNLHLLRSVVQRYQQNDEKEIPFAELFRKLETIKIITSPDSYYYSKRERLREIAETCLFHIAYGSGVGLLLSKAWNTRRIHVPRLRRESVQFPQKIYNSELVSLYQLAISNDIPILSYLVFYNIIEYFFTSATEAVLYNQLVQRLTLPEFSSSKNEQLRSLIKIVRKHDQKSDECNQLKIVLETSFFQEEIMEWISELEKDEPYYSVTQSLFGKKFKINNSPNHFFSSLASRIYHIRNVIVHNKESVESRYIPYSGGEQILTGELPLVQYIAEQLIIKNGNPIHS